MAAAVTGTPVSRATPQAGESISTLSITVPAGTTQLWVGAMNLRFTPPRTISSVVFNTSEALTQEASSVINHDPGSGDFTRAEWWRLDNPTATTANVVVTWSGGARGGVVAICLSGSATGAAAAVNTGSAASGALGVAVDTTPGGIVLSLAGIDNGDNVTVALTAGTELFNFIGSAGAGGNSTRVAAASQAGTGGSVTTTWTETGSTLSMVQSVVAVSAAGAASAALPAAARQRAEAGGPRTNLGAICRNMTKLGHLWVPAYAGA